MLLYSLESNLEKKVVMSVTQHSLIGTSIRLLKKNSFWSSWHSKSVEILLARMFIEYLDLIIDQCYGYHEYHKPWCNQTVQQYCRQTQQLELYQPLGQSWYFLRIKKLIFNILVEWISLMLKENGTYSGSIAVDVPSSLWNALLQILPTSKKESVSDLLKILIEIWGDKEIPDFSLKVYIKLLVKVSQAN